MNAHHNATTPADQTTSGNCPHCSRGPGAVPAHHDDCPRHPHAVTKLVQREREVAAAQYAGNTPEVEVLALDDPKAAIRAAFCAGAAWAASTAATRASG